MNLKTFLIIFSFFNVLISNSAELVQERYNHEFFLISNSEQFKIRKDVTNIAFNLNQSLGLSKFFDTSKIVDARWVKHEFEKDSTHSEETIKTEDGHSISYSYFNRNSDTVIIIGPGFTNNKEKMAPFVHMFAKYDIVLLNFRGHGHSSEIELSPLYKFMGIRTNTTLGATEEKDVFAVIQKLKKEKEYKQVIGLGICYGAFILAKTEGVAQASGLKAFDKLILDGCWLSLNNFINKIYDDPKLIVNPQTGGAPNWLKNLFKKDTTRCVCGWALKKILDFNNNIDIRDYLKHITIPTMLFYGKDDLTISRNDFEQIYNSINSTQKCAIITSNPHVHNHLRSKEFYKMAVDIFIENDINKFIELVRSQDKLEKHVIDYMKKSIHMSPTDFLKPKKITVKKSNKNYYIIGACIAAALILGYKYTNQ